MGKHGVPQFMWSQMVGHDSATEQQQCKCKATNPKPIPTVTFSICLSHQADILPALNPPRVMYQTPRDHSQSSWNVSDRPILNLFSCLPHENHKKRPGLWFPLPPDLPGFLPYLSWHGPACPFLLGTVNNKLLSKAMCLHLSPCHTWLIHNPRHI